MKPRASKASKRLHELKNECVQYISHLEELTGKDLHELDDTLDDKFWKAYGSDNMHELIKLKKRFYDLRRYIETR